MDLLSVLSLSANIFQLVGFTIQIVQLGKQIHERGTTIGYDELEVICKDFDNSRAILDARLSTVSTQTDEEKQLKAIAEQASALAAKLEKKLTKLKEHAPRSKPEAVKKAFKAVWSRNSVLEIETQFLRFRDELSFRLVVLLNGKIDEEAIKQSARFESLDDTTKQMINALLSFQHASEAWASQFLENQWRNERSAAQRHQELLELIQTAMPKELLNPNLAHISDYPQCEVRKKAIESAVLSSLWFPSIQDREYAIKEKYSDTFAWIWRDPRPIQKPWADFGAFLRSDMRAYWITGKPGSGKSTLMKYINNSEELDKALVSWWQDQPLIRLSFYFWYNGTPEQKSERGVLLSFLYQILASRKDLIPIAFKERVQFMSVSPNPPVSFHLETLELRRTIFTLLERLSDTKFFISIDGLDEYSRDRCSFTDVAQFFLSFLRLRNVKLLLSSRPEREFETEFESLPRLQLHDLTLPDIQTYTHEKLLQHPRLQDLQRADPARCDKLLTELVEGSAGVFLWVCVVVKTILIGLNNGEALDDLEAALKDLPTELDELYEKILMRIPRKYKSKAVLMMEIVRVGTENGCVLSTLGLSWALEPQEQVLRNKQPFTTDEIALRYGTLLAQTQSHTLGLLEILENGFGCQRDEEDRYVHVKNVISVNILPAQYCARASSLVIFLHRSVGEFMMKSSSYANFIEDAHSDGTQPALSLLQSAVANLKAQLSLIGERQANANLVEYGNVASYTYETVYSALHWARIVGDRGHVFLEKLDMAMSNWMRNSKIQESGQRWIRDGKDWHWTHWMPEISYQCDAVDGRDVDQFVIYASRHGLESFLRMKLNSMNGSEVDEKAKSYFLLNAVTPGSIRSPRFDLPVYPGIVALLLEAGASPRGTITYLHVPVSLADMTDMTPWGALISDIATNSWRSLGQLQATRFLIQQGANPNLIVDCTSTENIPCRRSVLRIFKVRLTNIMNSSRVNFSDVKFQERMTMVQQIIVDLESRSAVEQEWQNGVIIIDTSTGKDGEAIENSTRRRSTRQQFLSRWREKLCRMVLYFTGRF